MLDALHHPADIKNQPTLDSVTGLVNDREFERRLRRVLLTFSQEENDAEINEEHTLFRIDLEQFVIVNEVYGQLAGDALLRQFTLLLQQVVRVRDTLAYLQANEFGVLMEHCSLNHAHRIANKILQKARGFQFFYNDHCFDINVSIGIVPITRQTGNFVELFRQANAACNRAKDLNKNSIHLNSENHLNSTNYRGEPSWVADIYCALEEDRFLIFIQPIAPLKEREAEQVHYELLVRMSDKEGKLVLPNKFLPALERYSMSSVLDRWIINKAFQMIAERPEFLSSAQFFSINLSGQSLVNYELGDYILNELVKSGIPAEKVCFEITESSAISNLVVATDFIQTLKKKGCRFALDDFGSGFSSLLYLKKLPVDYLKIDGSFIRNITSESIDYAMVKSISEMGQVLGMETVAEYVESHETMQLLKDIGVDYAQGDSVGEPIPLAASFQKYRTMSHKL